MDRFLGLPLEGWYDGPFRTPFHLWSVAFLLFGLVVGSFLNVVIYRMPRGISTVTPPSHCPKCGTRIKLRHNLPVLSWLLLRARCAYCGAGIPARYVLVEAFTGALFLLTWLHFGKAGLMPPLALCLLFAGFLAATLIDIEHYIIPDQITLGGIFAGFVLSALAPALHGLVSPVAAMKASALGALAGGGLVYAVLRGGKLLFGKQRVEIPAGSRVLFTEEAVLLPGQTLHYDELFYRKSDAVVLEAKRIELADRCYWNRTVRVALRQNPPRLDLGEERFDASEEPWMAVEAERVTLPREAMGFGDVKFMAAIGAFLGWQAAVFSLMASAVIGSVVGVTLIILGRREWSARLPYGPFIAGAATLWAWGARDYVLNYFGVR